MGEEKKSYLSRVDFVGSLFLLSIFAVSLSVGRILITNNNRYWFLIWNLLLAWLPLLFAWILYNRLPHGIHWSYKNFALFMLWLLFLPNAFYLVSDFIHIKNIDEISLMYDVVLIGTYAWCGFILGYLSLFLVHKRALQYFGRAGHYLPLGALLLSGFAIYLGRYLRWNSWDVITNPFGLLFDLTNNFVNPTEHALSFSTTILFFVFLSAIYFVLWRAAQVIKEDSKK